MSQEIDAADAIRRAAQTYKHFVIAADILEQFGSLKQATEEGNRALVSVRAALVEANTELDALKEASNQARVTRSDIIDDANAKAVAIVLNADTKADEIIGKAVVSADATMQAAVDSANNTSRQVKAEVDRLKQDKTLLQDEISVLIKAKHDAADAADAAEARLAKARAAIAKLTEV